MIEPTQTLLFRRGRLPHWLVADRPFFVTLCRKGSLPTHMVAAYQAEREVLRPDVEETPMACGLARSGTSRATGAAHTSLPTDRAVSACPPVARDVSDRAGSDGSELAQRSRARWRQRFLKIDAVLDAAARSDPVLCLPSVAGTILDNFDWLRDRGWRIWAATLMPSHLHMVMRNQQGRNGALCNDLALFMSYTARRANEILGRSGAFWQSEPFDHWCRDPEAWCRSVSYTLHNPVKAGLCASWRDWPHSVADPDVEDLLA